MLVFNFLESFLDIIVLGGKKWGGGQWWGWYTSINFLDSAGVLLVVHCSGQEKEGEGGKKPRKMMTLSKSLEKSLI